MKHLIYTIMLLLFISSLAAQGFDVEFQPKTLMVNGFSTFDVDPLNPQAQPLLSTLRVSNNGAMQHFDLQVQIKWNNVVIVAEGEALFRSISELGAGATLNLSNRDLVSNESGMYLISETNIDLMQAVSSYPTLEDALLAGYFPDGNLELHVAIKAQSESEWEDSDVFTLVIRNAGSIFLSSPGNRINQVPAVISGLPLSFIWNSVATPFNDQYLLIKEFAPNEMPESQSVQSRGAVVFHQKSESGFAEYLPFKDGCYYAWQVYTPLHDGSNPYSPDLRNPNSPKRLESDWFVFRYAEDELGEMISQEMLGFLSQIQNQELLNLLLKGFKPTGEVILDGRSYKGDEALAILESLVGKNLQIEIKD